MKLLDGKSTLITGGSRGIGREIALEYARQGANVAFTYLFDTDAFAALEEEIRALGVKALSIQSNAADPAQAQEAVDKTIAAFGTLDVVVNNAGITRDNLLLRMSDEQFDQVIENNLYSVFYMTKASIKHMMKQRTGCFVNISSIVGVTGNAGQANYAASKAGMIGFTKSVAKELASRGIRANAIAPGFIATEMTHKLPPAELENWLKSIPLNRPGSPKDVADLCVFLASDMSSYMTGQVLHVDGGMHM